MSRPINIASIDTINIENKTTSFLYNFNKKIGNTFSVSYIDNSTTQIKGIKFAANPQKEDVVVRFNGTDYIFHAFIVTKDIDDSDNDYGIIIELYSINYTDTLFLQFPTSIESKKSDIDTMISKLDDDTADNIDGDTNEVYSVSEININPNTWFPTDETYEFYTLDDKNITFVMFSKQMTRTQDSTDILDTRFTTSFSSPSTITSTTTLPIFRSTESPKQMNIPDAEFQDIYIECSPEGDNVIRPQKVFTIRKLFDFGNNKESFVSNVEGFDADNIPEISRQFGIFLVGMVIFVIVYLMVNPEQIPAAVSNIFQKSTNYKISYKTNFYRYTIYVLTIFIAFCSLFFLLRDKPEILDYKTRFGALEIKKFPLVWFITSLFFVLFFVVLREQYSDYEEKNFKWLKEIIKKRIKDYVEAFKEPDTIFEHEEDTQLLEDFEMSVIVFLVKSLSVIVCLLVLFLITYLIVIYSEVDIWIMILFLCGCIVVAAGFLCSMYYGIIYTLRRMPKRDKITQDGHHDDLSKRIYSVLLRIIRKGRYAKNKTIRWFIDRFKYEYFITSIIGLFIYGFIYALTYLMLFFTTPRESLNLKSIAVFSLFISFLCYVHIYLKSLYDFFIPEKNMDNIKNHVNVAAVAVAATQNPNKT